MSIPSRAALCARLFPLSLAFTALACRDGSGDADSSEASLTDATTPLHCVLEYQSADGSVFGLAAQADGDLTSGVAARSVSSSYALSLTASPSAGPELTVQASITGPTGLLAYAALPRSAFLPGRYAFELGAPIPTERAVGYDGQEHDFDLIRGYCQAAADGRPPGAEQSPLDSKYFDRDLPEEQRFQRHNPDPTKVNVERLDALLAEAARQGSDAVIVAQDDVIIAEKYFGRGAQLAPVMSVTKSVVSMAVGALLDEGKIPSVDVPLSTYFSEWSAPPKKAATLRHLLTMTAGIVDTDDFWSHDDLLAYARSQPLAAAPGDRFSYSNASTMLLAGVIASAAGVSADEYVSRRLFRPIGIHDAYWARDGAGNVQTPGGLSLTPLDLLRLGTLVRRDGTWDGQSLLSSSWLATSTANRTPLEACYGYLWWVARPGCDGVHFGTASLESPVQGLFADGWGGNYVTVIPSSHIVAVRTRYPGPNATLDDEQRTRYSAFTQDVVTLDVH